MKLIELHEMTMRVGNLDKNATEFAERNSTRWLEDGAHVGDIEKFTIRKLYDVYSVWDSDELIACCTADKIPNNPAIVDRLWVKKERRGEKILSKLLWFLKSREGFDRMLLGNMHSDDTAEMIKGLRAFTKSWYKDGASEPFSIDTTDRYYSNKQPTGWQLMLENTYDFTAEMPRFYDINTDFIRTSYSAFID